jgi:hypothetical protein
VQRFGAPKLEQTGDMTIAAVSSKKRDAAVLEEADLDEQERRRKRAERFGTSAVVRSKLNCPMIRRCLRKLGAGCEGLMSCISALTILIYILLPLWILCTVMTGGGLFASTVAHLYYLP